MDATLTLVDLAGAIALLIWGVHMVQTGIMQSARDGALTFFRSKAGYVRSDQINCPRDNRSAI
jgi:phosphate:Na+ symporter